MLSSFLRILADILSYIRGIARKKRGVGDGGRFPHHVVRHVGKPMPGCLKDPTFSCPIKVLKQTPNKPVTILWNTMLVYIMERALCILASILLLMAALSGCLDDVAQDEPERNREPSVSVAYPSDGSTVSGLVVIGGPASDPDGQVEKVTVSILDAQMQGLRILNVTGKSDWQCQWDTTEYEDGQYAISVRSYDSNGSYSVQEYVDVIVANNVSNHPPVADFSFMMEGLTVSFTSRAYDVDNDSLHYQWVFGHQYEGPETTQPDPVHTFPSAGTYTIGLTVDDGEATDSMMTNITVSTGENMPPSCSLTVAIEDDHVAGAAPFPVTFVMNASDSDGRAEHGDTGTVPYQKHHVYTETGTYTATLTVEDDRGADASATIEVNVIEP